MHEKEKEKWRVQCTIGRVKEGKENKEEGIAQGEGEIEEEEKIEDWEIGEEEEEGEGGGKKQEAERREEVKREKGKRNYREE